jgi:wobble nucleotide-excising tRNase
MQTLCIEYLAKKSIELVHPVRFVQGSAFMINKVLNIKNLGIFSNCQWSNEVENFCRFNLIYGWNGSGKTTFTKLFNLLDGENDDEFPECTFKVEAEDGTYSNSDTFTKTIRVFNQEYTDRNITLKTGKTNPIFILGEESKELAAQIEADEIQLNGDSSSSESIGLIAERKQVIEKKESKKNEKGKLFTDVAKLIGASTTGVLSRNYRKPNAESQFETLKDKELLSEVELEQHKTTLKQNLMSSELQKVNLTQLVARIEAHEKTAKLLLLETVESITLENLSGNEKISNWVEKGLEIHVEDNLKKCGFCEQKLSSERISSLLSHFNDADKSLKDKIDISLQELRNIYKEVDLLSLLDDANFYEEFREEYNKRKSSFLKLKQSLLSNITSYGEALNKKKMNTTAALDLSESIETAEILACSIEINKIISDHCSKSAGFETQKKNAASLIERHYLSEMIDSVNILENEIATLSSAENVLMNGDGEETTGILQIKERVEENRKKISTAGPAVDALNDGLETFLGRSEISFILDDDGYSICRNGNPVKNLSEGEKTAIAFIYFTIHLEDMNFEKKNGIVVIDDPISSLDSNSIFQAFSFLKNAVKDAHQVFILTHNFDFLRLLLGWLKNGVKANERSYYMIKNTINDDKRIAQLDKLDGALEKFDSEYQYLFKLLLEFTHDGTIASVYHVPNVARKVLETFLMLTFPDNRRIYRKMEEIDFDEVKKTSIYKFTNDQSHMTGKGFDPSLVPECQNNVKYLLELIQSVFPSHYESLKKVAM